MAIATGSKLPAPPASLWENAPENTVNFPDTGKIILLGVPGAFTRTYYHYRQFNSIPSTPSSYSKPPFNINPPILRFH